MSVKIKSLIFALPALLLSFPAAAVLIDNFSPRYSYTIAATSSSSNQAMTQNTPATGGSPMKALEIQNNATTVVHVHWGKGTQTATTSDYAVLPGVDKIVDMGSGYDNVAVILESGTGNVFISLGDGS